MMTTEQKLWLWGRTIFRASKPVLIYVFMPGLCMALGYMITGPDMTAQEFFVYGSNFYTALGMTLALVLFSKLYRRKGSSLNEEVNYRPETIDWKKAAVFLVFGMAAAVVLSAVLTLFPVRSVLSSYSEASGRMYKGNDLVFAIGTTVFLGPVLEEVVFRGLLLNRLLEGFSERTAVYVSAALFAVFHGNLLWILYAFAMGLFMTRLSMKEDGIFYPICIHAGFNFPSAIICIIQYFPESNRLFLGNKILIFLYGTAAAAVLLLCRLYWKNTER